ncbi:MAG TPA: HIT family protein [Rhizomicrobium sp.]|nr:HIT family protein [Rhizomicrobium sp.]
MEATRWDRWAEGIDCPFDAPRAASNEYWDFIAALTVSSLYLSSNQTYRGHCLLVLDIRHAIRPDQLSAEEWAAFCADLYLAQKAMMRVLQPDHINAAVLGNVIPHLHWHIVPRTRDDPRWEAPIWTTTEAEMTVTALAANERAELIEKLRDAVRPSN